MKTFLHQKSWRVFLATSLALSGLAIAGEEAPQPGEIHKLRIDPLPGPVLYRLPKNYTADRPWPVLVFYHGTGGSPTFRLVDEYTGGKDFISIAMTYVRPGRFQYSEENLREEIAACHETIDRVAKHCRLDRERIYVGGFSKGGWISAMFIDHDHRFAGGFVMGGGVYDRQLYEAKPFARRTPVYIGVGRSDGNTIMSLNAKLHFRDLGAEVTLDVWPEIGHTWPLGPHRSPAFQQWLEMIVLGDRPKKLEYDMQAWFERDLKRVEGIVDPRERYMAIQNLAEMPATVFLGKTARAQLQTRLDGLREKEPVKTEWEIQQRYQRIVRHELKDRSMETLKTCARGYQNLARDHPDSLYGKLAAIDFKRTRELIDHSERQREETGKEKSSE